AAAAQRRIFTCISASDLHHHLFCNFFMFGISCRDSLGSLCSFHLSFCESFSSLLCESFSSLLFCNLSWDAYARVSSILPDR
ncbi:unnamed protein product, partial [Prunus brigantina]